MAVIWWLLVGLAIGLLMHRVTPGRTPGGAVGSGVGGVLGGVLGGIVHAFTTGAGLTGISLIGTLAAAAGALVVVGLFRLASGTTGRRMSSTRR